MTHGSLKYFADTAEDRASTASKDWWQLDDWAGGTLTEDALLERHLPLVRAMVRSLARTLPAHVGIEDLESAGMLGLLQAIRNFDSRHGASFKTYACCRIRGAVFDELRRMDWVPRLIHEKARKIQQVLGKLEQRLGAEPSERQMADALGISSDDYRSWLDETRPVAFVCLDGKRLAGTPGDATPHESIPDESQEDPFEHASRSDLNAFLAGLIRQLPPIQQRVMALYYSQELRFREIAELCGLTEARICQIHAKAILTMRGFIQQQEATAAAVARCPAQPASGSINRCALWTSVSARTGFTASFPGFNAEPARTAPVGTRPAICGA